MPYLRYLAPVLFSVLLTTAQAQLRGGMGGGIGVGNIHVHVVLENERDAGPHLTVRLMEGSSDTVLQTTYTNDVGEAELSGVPVGGYHVEVSGDGVQTTTSDTFEVDERKVTQSQYIVVRQSEDTGPKPLSGKSPMVSASDLNVPPKARKEVDKANQAMAEHDWKKALEHLNKAIALDPKYATAYNNLGVLYAKTNDSPHEEEALKKAIELDDHFAPALVNYGKLSLREKNTMQAEVLFQKAATAEPENSETLMLLAYSAYMNRQFNVAIINADQAHRLGNDHPSFVHYIAGRAYQQENKEQQALTEFQLFLKEEPKGPRADHVRADVERIQEASQQTAAQ